MTLEVALMLARDRQAELLKLAQETRLADDRPGRRPSWQRFVGRLLVRIGIVLTTWGASLKHEAADYGEGASVPTISLAR
jgi:hypothetical protein